MQRIATDGILLSILLVSIFSLIGLFSMDPLFKFMGANGRTLPLIKSFMTIWYSAVIVVMIPPVSDGAMRAIGDTLRPFKVMLTCALFNLVLDPIFIFGWFGLPAMGIQGAAIATVVSRCIGMWVSLYYNYRVHKLISIKNFQVTEVLESWKQIVKLGIPSVGVVMLPQVIRICLTSLAAYTGGTQTVASVAIGSRIESFSLIIAMSIGSCIVPLVGQNYGAKKFDRVSEIQRMLSKIALLASGVILVIVVTLSTPIIKIFSTEFQVIRYTYIYLLILTIGSIGLNLYNFNTQVLNALGLSKKAFTINSIGTFIVILPLMFLGSTISFTYMLFGLGLGQILLGFYSSFYGKQTTNFRLETIHAKNPI
jgi:putative MATE family efflux protein